MSKRKTEIQGSSWQSSFVGDGSALAQNMDPSKRATAAQMASRKIRQAKSHRRPVAAAAGTSNPVSVFNTSGADTRFALPPTSQPNLTPFAAPTGEGPSIFASNQAQPPTQQLSNPPPAFGISQSFTFSAPSTTSFSFDAPATNNPFNTANGSFGSDGFTSTGFSGTIFNLPPSAPSTASQLTLPPAPSNPFSSPFQSSAPFGGQPTQPAAIFQFPTPNPFSNLPVAPPLSTPTAQPSLAPEGITTAFGIDEDLDTSMLSASPDTSPEKNRHANRWLNGSTPPAGIKPSPLRENASTTAGNAAPTPSDASPTGNVTTSHQSAAKGLETTTHSTSYPTNPFATINVNSQLPSEDFTSVQPPTSPTPASTASKDPTHLLPPNSTDSVPIDADLMPSSSKSPAPLAPAPQPTDNDALQPSLARNQMIAHPSSPPPFVAHANLLRVAEMETFPDGHDRTESQEDVLRRFTPEQRQQYDTLLEIFKLDYALQALVARMSPGGDFPSVIAVYTNKRAEILARGPTPEQVALSVEKRKRAENLAPNERAGNAKRARRDSPPSTPKRSAKPPSGEQRPAGRQPVGQDRKRKAEDQLTKGHPDGLEASKKMRSTEQSETAKRFKSILDRISPASGDNASAGLATTTSVESNAVPSIAGVGEPVDRPSSTLGQRSGIEAPRCVLSESTSAVMLPATATMSTSLGSSAGSVSSIFDQPTPLGPPKLSSSNIFGHLTTTPQSTLSGHLATTPQSNIFGHLATTTQSSESGNEITVDVGAGSKREEPIADDQPFTKPERQSQPYENESQPYENDSHRKEDSNDRSSEEEFPKKDTEQDAKAKAQKDVAKPAGTSGGLFDRISRAEGDARPLPKVMESAAPTSPPISSFAAYTYMSSFANIPTKSSNNVPATIDFGAPMTSLSGQSNSASPATSFGGPRFHFNTCVGSTTWSTGAPIKFGTGGPLGPPLAGANSSTEATGLPKIEFKLSPLKPTNGPNAGSPSSAAGSTDGTDAEGDTSELNRSRSSPGEEDDEVIFKVRARASSYEKADLKEGRTKGGWNSQGLGVLRVLRDKESGRARVVMRHDPRGHVLLNTALINGVTYAVIGERRVSLMAAAENGTLTAWAILVKDGKDATDLAALLEEEKRKM